jgi:serine/threonine protein kinase
MKIGSFSVILNSEEYLKNNIVFPYSDTQVLYKVTQMNSNHGGEEKYIDFLNISNDYVTKNYKETIKNINKDDKLLEYIKDNIKQFDEYNINNIFYKNILTEYKIVGYFVENAGNIDLFDTLTDLINLEDNIWVNGIENNINSKVYEFSYHMCKCLEYLQDNKMGHFDIKPENIIYSDNLNISFGKRFKLIDFGFADKYPFEKYSNKMSGTPIYTPCLLKNYNYPEWALKIKTNDWLYNPARHKYYHYICYNYVPELIYKTDVFSMGVVFTQLLYYINDYLYRLQGRTLQFNNLNKLIKHMTHKDIVIRYFSIDCINYLDKYLDEDEINDNDCGSFNCFNKCFKN